MPDWIENGYELVVAFKKRHDGSLTRERVETMLVDHAEFPDDPTDAEYAVEYLLNNGWLYEVRGDLRITDEEPSGEDA